LSNIGIIHYKAGGTDGVSLEIEKWKKVLEEIGHSVYLCAGELDNIEGTLIEELYHHRPDAKRQFRNTFIALSDYDETVYTFELYHMAEVIEKKLKTFISAYNIDLLIPQNIWSVAANPPAAIALARVKEKMGVPAIAHNHDFYWESVGGVALTCSAAVELADKYLPPRNGITHAVINSLTQKELYLRKGIQSIVVPNVFDFEGRPWEPDEYNRDFRARIGLGENDVFILQATRIVFRKGIELAIDFVRALDTPERRTELSKRGLYDGRPFTEDSRIVLVLAGYTYDDLTGLYLDLLKEKVAQSGIEALFVGDHIAGHRQIRKGKKLYSLWDTYVYADFVTYPSLWEGWGNQLLEAIRARLPIMLFEYPVYKADIKPTGLRSVSLGNELYGYDPQGLAQINPEIVESAADHAVELLTNNELRQEMVEHNYRIGVKHYSLGALRGYLERLLADVGK
jgi:glycosyltransferase involved in cell wall biosynthesis